MPKLTFLNIISQFKESEIFGEMGDSRLGAGNVQDDSRTSCHVVKQESYQRLMVLCQRNSGAKLKNFPLAKYGSIWTSVRVITLMD